MKKILLQNQTNSGNVVLHRSSLLLETYWKNGENSIWKRILHL